MSKVEDKVREADSGGEMRELRWWWLGVSANAHLSVDTS